MLVIDIPSAVYEVPGSWDGKNRVKKLVKVPPIHLEMEHSLLSISKWESKWKIPFAQHKNMTSEQFLDYCRCMTINRQKDPNVYQYLRRQDAAKISPFTWASNRIGHSLTRWPMAREKCRWGSM